MFFQTLSYGRPVLAAIEMWQLDEHKWMFQEENKDAQALIELLMDFMERTLPHCTFLRNSMALKTPSLKSDPVMLELSQTQSDLEAGCCSKTINKLSLHPITAHLHLTKSMLFNSVDRNFEAWPRTRLPSLVAPRQWSSMRAHHRRSN